MRNPWTTCPLCGARAIDTKRSNLSVELPRGIVVVPGMERHECKVCREQFFAFETSKRIDKYCLEGKDSLSKTKKRGRVLAS